MKKKRFIAIGLTICMVLSLCACQKNNSIQEKKESQTLAKANEAVTPKVTETPTPTKEPENEDEKEASTEANKETGAIDEDWTKMQFAFDGGNYEIPFTYQSLKDAGWSCNLTDYGYEDGYLLNPGDKTYGTIDLTNPAYKDSKISVQVGFINNGEKAKDILDCNIWDFVLDTCYGFKQQEKYPDMEIAKGIKIGSSRKDVDAAFGPCDDIFEAKEDGYVTYTYSVDYSKYLKFTIYDTLGVTSIELSSY